MLPNTSRVQHVESCSLASFRLNGTRKLTFEIAWILPMRFVQYAPGEVFKIGGPFKTRTPSAFSVFIVKVSILFNSLVTFAGDQKTPWFAFSTVCGINKQPGARPVVSVEPTNSLSLLTR